MGRLGEWFWPGGILLAGVGDPGEAALIWFRAISDGLLAVADGLILVALVRFVRGKRDVPVDWRIVSLGGVIVACGLMYVMDMWVLWVPAYWFAGGIKAITALAAIPAAAFLVRLAPQAASYSSAEELKAAKEELKRQDAILRKSEERFQKMAENIQEIFWMMNPATKEVSYVSPAFEQICELPLESIHKDPMSYREIIHPEDRQRVLRKLAEWESTNGFEEEFRIHCPSGKVKWVRATGLKAKDAKGNNTALVGTVQEITSWKVMEAALRESEDLFRDMVEHSSDLICTYTLEGRLLSVNEMPAQLLGYTREEVLAKPMREFLLPEARAQFDESLKKIQRDGFAKGLMVVLTKTGERRIWEYQNTLRTDGVSVPIVRGVAHDVTEQKRMEKALRHSEEKFSKAFLASPYALVMSTMEEGRLLEVNDSLLRVLELSREEVIGRTSLEFGVWIRPSDREEIRSQIRDKGRVESKEVMIRTKSGRQVVVNYAGEVIDLEGRKCLLSVFEDITERKRVEERLREYEKAIESVEEMIAVVGRDYRYLLANRSFVNFRGRTKEQVVGHLVSEVLDESFFERVVKPRMDEAFHGNAVKYETRYTYPNIGERDLLVSYLPFEGSEGIDRVVCVLRDITARKRAEQELGRLSGELLRLQDEERRKIARDLHDTTGQDLVALAATLSQLHDAIPSTNRKCRKLIAQCQAVSARSLREVRTLSYLLHPPMLDEAGLEDAMKHFADGYEARTGIQVEFEIPPDFGRLPQGIELALFRVVQESLVNIQRHSGSFTAKIELNRDEEEVCLRVSDTGRGMSASHRKQSGTLPLILGVGIPSMEERIRQVGGRLKIESTESGTTVRVIVPSHEKSE